jgi:hypothetical protein
MLDRALAKMFSEISTLILVACVFTVPVHLVHAYVFKDELSVRELGPEIAELDERSRVRGVDTGDVGLERRWLAIVVMVELAASAIVFRAARRVYSVGDAGGVPGVADAYRNLGSTGPTALPRLAPVAVLTVVAGLTAWLLLAIGGRIADMAPADLAWVSVGAARAVAMAVFLAMAAGGAAALPAAGRSEKTPAADKLELY